MSDILINPNDRTLDLDWGTDFIASQNGGLVLVGGWAQDRQRILRRILTNPKFTLHDGQPISADYIYDQNYGIGSRRTIGEPFSKTLEKRLRTEIRKGVLVDQGVDTTRDPIITIKEQNHRVYIAVVVFLKTGKSGTIVFNYSNG